MKLTLRKANAVQAAINEAIKGLDLPTQVELNEFEDVSDQIQNVRDRFHTNNITRDHLINALYDIRRAVAQANASSGINDLLADIARLEKNISYSAMLANKGAQTSLRVLDGRLKKAAEETSDRHSRMFGYDTVTTSVFTEEEIEYHRKNAARCKRTKQKLQDRLLELNVQTEIELDKETADFLEREDIL